MGRREADFTVAIKNQCAARTGYKCSNPNCRRSTSGPHSDPSKSTNTGEAAHIHAAQPGGPRYDPMQTDSDRRSIENALWLCGSCHKLFDTDWQYYSAEILIEWKIQAEEKARAEQAGKPQASVLPSPLWQYERWNHETTDDANYVKRDREIGSFVGWFNDSSIRCVSLIGLGGVGKTSLVGHVLKSCSAMLSRDTVGIFYWSFYAERQTSVFIEKLVSFIEEITDENLTKNSISPLEGLLRGLGRIPPMTLVLDGLEVLQETVSAGSAHGAFIDADLRDLVLSLTDTKKPWITVATSRFPLTDLNRNPRARSLKLDRVAPREGAQILTNLGVLGSLEDRCAVSEQLDGHALCLRLFSATIPIHLLRAPASHAELLFKDIDGTFGNKLQRLLTYYQDAISVEQNAILSSLALMRSPSAQNLLLSLATRLLEQEIEPSLLAIELKRLSAVGLVLLDNIEGVSAYSCHPIIRDYFRDTLLQVDRDAGMDAARYLAEAQPDANGLVGATRLEPILLAIETFLESNAIENAKSLYVDRLEKGGVFLSLGLPKDGKRICHAFLKSFLRDPGADKKGDSIDRKHFLNGAIEFAIHLGELDDGLRLAEEALTCTTGHRRHIPYRAQARIFFRLGNFSDAIKSNHAALKAVERLVRPDASLARSLAYYELLKSYICTGAMIAAEEAFEKLKQTRNQLDSPDAQVLLDLSNVRICLAHRDNQKMKKASSRLSARLNNLSNKQLRLEGLLVLASAYLYLKQWEKASVIADEAYDFSTAQNCPYELCWSQLLQSYSEFGNNGSFEQTRTRRMLEKAIASGFEALAVDARVLLSMISGFEGENPEYFAQIIGYEPTRYVDSPISVQ